MRFLGIDQSFTSCGIVVLDDNNMVYFQIIESNPQNSIYQRSWFILSQINQIIIRYQVNYIGIEGLAMAIVSGNATRSLAILQGVLVTNLLFLPPHGNQLKDPYLTLVAPMQLKKYATGKGKANKSDMIKAVPSEIKQGWKFIPKISWDDLADAYFIAKYLQQNYSTFKDLKQDTVKSTKNKSTKTKILNKPRISIRYKKK